MERKTAVFVSCAFAPWFILWRVYTCRFDNHVPKEKLGKKVFSCCQARGLFLLWRG